MYLALLSRLKIWSIDVYLINSVLHRGGGGEYIISSQASVDRTVTLSFSTSRREGKGAHFNGTIGNFNKSITGTPSAFVKI